MDISTILSDLISEFKARTKNRIYASIIVTWLAANTSHWVNILFAEKTTSELVNHEIELALFDWKTWIGVICVWILYVYYLPKVNLSFNTFLFNRIEKDAYFAKIDQSKELEGKKRELIDVRSGNAEKEQLILQISDLRKNEESNLSKIKELDETITEINSLRADLTSQLEKAKDSFEAIKEEKNKIEIELRGIKRQNSSALLTGEILSGKLNDKNGNPISVDEIDLRDNINSGIDTNNISSSIKDDLEHIEELSNEWERTVNSGGQQSPEYREEELQSLITDAESLKSAIDEDRRIDWSGLNFAIEDAKKLIKVYHVTNEASIFNLNGNKQANVLRREIRKLKDIAKELGKLQVIPRNIVDNDYPSTPKMFVKKEELIKSELDNELRVFEVAQRMLKIAETSNDRNVNIIADLVVEFERELTKEKNSKNTTSGFQRLKNIARRLRMAFEELPELHLKASIRSVDR